MSLLRKFIGRMGNIMSRHRILGMGSVNDKLMEYENGDMSVEDSRGLFQYLVDTGLAWQLQGHYGRTAQRMIDAGELNYGAGSDHAA